MMDIFALTDTTIHDEKRQGEAFAPFALDSNSYKKLFYIESYGCAMNFADSEVVASILQNNGLALQKILKKQILSYSTPAPFVKRLKLLYVKD